MMGEGKDEVKNAEENGKAYWRATLKLLTVVLVIWAVVAYGLSIVFAPALNNFSLGGYPLGFWFAQQGSLYVFVILIFAYAKIIEKIDRKYDVNE